MNIKQLQSFIGMINFYSKFAHKYAETTAPLYKLLKKGARFIWTEKQQTAFDTIKEKFQKDLILMHPNPNRSYILYTDSSNAAIGGALAQLHDFGEEKIITFVSRTLKPSEVLYFVTGNELFSLVYCLKKLRTYLIYSKVVIKTDHKPLIFMKSCKFANDRNSKMGPFYSRI